MKEYNTTLYKVDRTKGSVRNRTNSRPRDRKKKEKNINTTTHNKLRLMNHDESGYTYSCRRRWSARGRCSESRWQICCWSVGRGPARTRSGSTSWRSDTTPSSTQSHATKRFIKRAATRAILGIFDHPRSGVVYNFGCVCLSVCQTITFENFDVGSSYSHIRYISWEYGSSSYMKVIGSRSRSQEQQRSKISIPEM